MAKSFLPPKQGGVSCHGQKDWLYFVVAGFGVVAELNAGLVTVWLATDKKHAFVVSRVLTKKGGRSRSVQ